MNWRKRITSWFRPTKDRDVQQRSFRPKPKGSSGKPTAFDPRADTEFKPKDDPEDKWE